MYICGVYMKKLSEEKIEKIKETRRNGYSYHDIADKVSVSPYTARKYAGDIDMKEDKRWNGAKQHDAKEDVKNEVKKVLPDSEIKPRHQQDYDQFVAEETDRIIKGLAQFLGASGNRFLGIFGAGRSLANITYDTGLSDKYSVLPVVRKLVTGEEKLPALPLRRRFFIQRIANGIVSENWEKIEEWTKV